MKTINPIAAMMLSVSVGFLLIGGITAIRGMSADANAKECVSKGYNVDQCWKYAQPSF